MNANNRKRVAEENAKELLETREWVQGVMGGGGGGAGGLAGVDGGTGEGEGGVTATQDKARMLGAGVLVEIGEIIKEWQRVMVGELGGFL